MKALPKLMKNSSLTIDIAFEETGFSIHMVGARAWPFSAHLDTKTRTLNFYDLEGELLHELPPSQMTQRFLDQLPVNMGLAFVGVTESTVDFKSRSQHISAKMRAINKDAHENIHMDNGWGDDE